MYIAQVTQWGELPKQIEVAKLPEPQEGQVRIKVEAVGIHRVVQSRAAGQHYSANVLPHTPGVDGVGTTSDGSKVYFTTFSPTSGSLAEYVNVPKAATFPVPDGADPIQIAAMVNPALSSWLALTARAAPLPKDFSVLIIGVTSASGKLAIEIARALGAKRVVGAARNPSAMSALGLDEQIVIAGDAGATDFNKLGDVDVVLDYVYGPVTEALFAQLKSARPFTYVQIGSLASTEISLKGEWLRGKNLTIRGSGPGAWTMQEAAQGMTELLKILARMPAEPVKTAPLRDVERVWTSKGPERLVILP